MDTEAFGKRDARALWKIIDSGYGVCNGIAQVEKYILNKAGIESEMVYGKSHTFLELKIDTIGANGEVIKGETILDPTWNLAAHRYGGKPNNFCITYEQARGNDRSSGIDSLAHLNDEELESATAGLDEQTLRQVYTSIDIADKDGKFPIEELMNLSKKIDDSGFSDEESLKRQLVLLSEKHPDFATCQRSTITALKDVFLNNANLNFNRCVVDRVYDRQDEKMRPVLYVYADLPEGIRKFYFANKEIKGFSELSQQDFEAKFECYESDLEMQDGMRPWEVAQHQDKEDLTRGSGNVVAAKEENKQEKGEI